MEQNHGETTNPRADFLFSYSLALSCILSMYSMLCILFFIGCLPTCNKCLPDIGTMTGGKCHAIILFYSEIYWFIDLKGNVV